MDYIFICPLDSFRKVVRVIGNEYRVRFINTIEINQIYSIVFNIVDG